MEAIGQFVELLKAVTVDCKDDGTAFVVSRRLEVIERLLDATPYRLVAREPLALLFAKKRLNKGDSVVLVSSHIDCVYDSCFCSDEGEFLRGTFDNSFGNAAVLWAMMRGELPDDVVVAFTGDEECDSRGAVQTVLSLGRLQCNVGFALVLEVTNVGWESEAHFALENDLGIDLRTAHSIVEAAEGSGAIYAFEHNAESDESWNYADYGIPSLTLSMPVCGNMHSDEGVLLRKKGIGSYCRALQLIVDAVV
mgnify:CR=1 FL=1